MSVALEAQALRRVFRSYRRAPGWRGLWKNLVNREMFEIVAIEHIDLKVDRGEFLGLIGPNGAGKTTLVKALTGIIPVTSGSARLLGTPAFQLGDEQKRRLALVMGQRSQLWWDLPALDSFRLLQAIYAVPEGAFQERLAAFAAMLGVEGLLGRQLRQLSLGERMKMELIGAFVHGPEIVFLDEPTIGLDLLSKEAIRRFLVEINRDSGVTLVLTSHDMEDIEDTCRRLVILEQGKVLYDGDLVSLSQRVVGRRAVEIQLEPGSAVDEQGLEDVLERLGGTVAKRTTGGLTLLAPAVHTRELVRALFDLVAVRDLSIERQPLEHLIRDIYAGRGGLG